MGFNPHPIVRLDGSPKCLKQLLTSLCFNPQPNITLVVNKIQNSSLSWNDVSILSHPERWMYAEFNLYMEALYGFNPHPIINWMGKLAHLYWASFRGISILIQINWMFFIVHTTSLFKSTSNLFRCKGSDSHFPKGVSIHIQLYDCMKNLSMK